MILENPPLLKEVASGPCESCGGLWEVCAHHLYRRGFGGGSRMDVPWNLVALCFACHAGVHDGKISDEKMLAIVAEREDVTPEVVMDFLNWLARQPPWRDIEATFIR